MANRVELNEQAMQDVVGGALVWGAEGVYAKDNPDIIFQFGDYKACRDYIQKHWRGGAQTLATLEMLEDAGLVWR